jgi:hypothetical protein
MWALSKIIPARKRLAVAVLSENTLVARPTVKTIHVEHRCGNLRAWATSLLPNAGFIILVGILITPMLLACSAVQTQENTLEQIATIDSLRYGQLLTNLSNAIDQVDSVPSQGVPSNGVATNVSSGMFGFTFTQPFDFAHNTKTFTPTVMLNWQNNWTITPVSDPQDLQNLRSLYSLLYNTDPEIAQFVIDTLWLFAARMNGRIDTDWMDTQQKYCGVSWRRYGIEITDQQITDPDAAAASYFGAWNAFPAVAEESKCYVTNGRPLGVITSTSLAKQYGLLYPSKQEVLAELRNGLSPSCRSYQLSRLRADDSQNPGKQRFRYDTLFQRWLFWKDSNGNWQPSAPNGPPQGYRLEYLGKYGTHDFWTTSAACLHDFIVLSINATANSHAAAQNAPKPTGPTPATPGT